MAQGERATGRSDRVWRRGNFAHFAETDGIIGLDRVFRPIPLPSRKPDDRNAGGWSDFPRANRVALPRVSHPVVGLFKIDSPRRAAHP